MGTFVDFLLYFPVLRVMSGLHCLMMLVLLMPVLRLVLQDELCRARLLWEARRASIADIVIPNFERCGLRNPD